MRTKTLRTQQTHSHLLLWLRGGNNFLCGILRSHCRMRARSGGDAAAPAARAVCQVTTSLARAGPASSARSGLCCRADEIKQPGAQSRGGASPSQTHQDRCLLLVDCGLHLPTVADSRGPCLGESGGAPGLKGRPGHVLCRRAHRSQDHPALSPRASSPAGGWARAVPVVVSGSLCFHLRTRGPLGPEARPASSVGGGV